MQCTISAYTLVTKTPWLSGVQWCGVDRMSAHPATSDEYGGAGYRRGLFPLGMAALGVVYGDLGTSPLYTLRACFGSGLLPTPANVLGILSLVLWSLIIVISIKYQLFVMRADNHGEGGILALLSQLDPWRGRAGRKTSLLITLGIFGAALLYGDGVITPAISVLSAVEGLELSAPALQDYVVPITVAVLAVLFLLQKRGTGGIGSVFGPVMMIWFCILGVLGVLAILRNPEVLQAFSPWYAIQFFLHNGVIGFLVLGAAFLALTGGEALYADMGHFGLQPIRLGWFGLVLPALMLNYLGQGAIILDSPGAAAHPFYALAPAGWTILPLVAIATVATVIASQGVISGAFSLASQAVHLGQMPRVTIVQTSATKAGQVYVPSINRVMMVVTIALVVGFGSSEALAGAYGIAVSTTMVITTVLTYFVMRQKWAWRWPAAFAVTGFFLCFDVPFFAANLLKIMQGGWFPLTAGLLVFVVMSTWGTGRRGLIDRLRERTQPLSAFMGRIRDDWPPRVPGTAVFMTAPNLGTPPVLQYHLEFNQVLHERVILLTIMTRDIPYVPTSERIEVEPLERGIYRVFLYYGFMQTPNVPLALQFCERHGLDIDIDSLTYYLGRETLVGAGGVPKMMAWREKLFAFMARNALRATDFYRIPPQRAIEIGIRLDMAVLAGKGSARS